MGVEAVAAVRFLFFSGIQMAVDGALQGQLRGICKTESVIGRLRKEIKEFSRSRDSATFNGTSEAHWNASDKQFGFVPSGISGFAATQWSC